MNLESIKFGRAVEEINAGAFSNCGKLKTVIIPSAVKTIGPRCFKDCANLSEVCTAVQAGKRRIILQIIDFQIQD